MKESTKQVLTTLLVVALVVAAIAIIWGVLSDNATDEPDQNGAQNQNRMSMCEQDADCDQAQRCRDGECIAQDTETEDWQEYDHETLGLTFRYPQNHEVREDREMAGEDRGDLQEITVSDEDGEEVFILRAMSSDFDPTSEEGCCFTYTQDLNLSQSITRIKQDVEDELRRIFNPFKTRVDGKDALGFFYVISYQNSDVVASRLIALDHNTYDVALMRSGSLYRVDEGFDGAIDEIERLFENAQDAQEIDELDQERLELFEQILSTIRWYNSKGT